MSSRKRLLKNVSWNWIGMAVEAVVGFMILPLLVSRLGVEGYGLWVIIGSLTGSFQFLDFGLRASVGRFVAFYNAQEDDDSLSRVLSTATTILAVLGAIAFTGVAILSFFLPHLIEIPIGQLESARLALLLVGTHLGLWLVLRIFDGALIGLQRFDLVNMIDVALAIIRLGLVYFLVNESTGLVTLACITLGMTVATGGIKAAFSANVMNRVKIRKRYVSRSTIRELAGYGVWNFVSSIANMFVNTLFPVLIGTVLGLAFVAPFAIAKRLIDIIKQFMMASTGVLTPHNTALFARNELDHLRSMYLEVSRYCATVALVAVIGLSVLSKSFLGLWVGEEFAHLWRVVAVLAIGAFIPMLAYLANGILQGMSKHRCLAVFGILNAVFAFSLSALSGPRFGLLGAAISLAASSTIFSGCCPVFIVMGELNVAFMDYLKQSIVPAITVTALPAIALIAAVFVHDPSSWLLFICYGSVFTLSTFGLSLIDYRKRNRGKVVLSAQKIEGFDSNSSTVSAT